jgi:hypothetical protein
MELDESVYPDVEPPSTLETDEDKADYVHRICSAFDFGVPPEAATILLFEGWKQVFDRFPLSGSPAYHAFRTFFGWAPVERSAFLGEPGYRKLDAAEGREDGCEDRV